VKFLAIDKYDVNHVQDQKSQRREQHLKRQIKVYSKMTHASAWAILGTCSWENMTLLLFLKANGYTAECVKYIQYIAKKTGLPADTPMPKV
jgi:hypothetical protein